MTFQYLLTKDININEAMELYRTAGWLDETDSGESFQKMLDGTHTVAAAFTESGKLAGMARVLSDGVSDAYLLDLVVHPDYRKNGVGHRIVELLTAHVKSLGISWFVCIGAPGTETFYQHSSGKTMVNYTPVRF